MKPFMIQTEHSIDARIDLEWRSSSTESPTELFRYSYLHITIKVLEEINSMRCTKEIDPLYGHVNAVPYLGYCKCGRLESALTLDFLTLRGEMYSHIAILG